MSTVAAIKEHPARWSASVLNVLTDMARAEIARHEPRTVLRAVDPFAGVGLPRLREALHRAGPIAVTGVELQPEWAATSGCEVGDATALPAEWSGRFHLWISSPSYANRMADRHDAKDACKTCGGRGEVGNGTDPATGSQIGDKPCPTCKGHGLSLRNTYAHVLRRNGADIVDGSAAALNWGPAYRELHRRAIGQLIDVTVPGGLGLTNMSNHIRDHEEQLVVEWWVSEFLAAGCKLVEVRPVKTRRQKNGANADKRAESEFVIAVRTPNPRRLL